MIGDDETNDIVGAKNANIDQVFFNPGNILISVQPTYEIRRLLELRDYL
jgi:putative hydrolase of the HAD superfamily